MSALLSAALAAAARGWPIFPLLPGTKRPRFTCWEQRATLDSGRIRHWWSRHPGDNIAIATGPARLVVVDLDVAEPEEAPPDDWPGASGGLDVYLALAEARGHVRTWTVATAGGGWHLYYRAPAGRPWRNTSGRLGWHIDTRAGGGYVVAAGSIVDGRPYYTLSHQLLLVELPAWIAERLGSPPAQAPARPPATQALKARSYAPAALAGEVQRVLDAPPGQRNAALNRAAWNLARHIANGILDRGDVEAALQAAGEAAGGQTPAGVAATIRSAIDARLRSQQ